MEINVGVKRSNLGNMRKFKGRIKEINDNLLKVKGYTLDADRADLREIGRHNGFSDFVLENISDAQWKMFVKEAHKMLSNKNYLTEEELTADKCNLLHMDLGIEAEAIISDVFYKPVAIRSSTTVSAIQALYESGLRVNAVYSDVREEFMYADGNKGGYSLDRKKFETYIDVLKDVLNPLGVVLLVMREEDLDFCLSSIREAFGLHHIEHRLVMPTATKIKNNLGKGCNEIMLVVKRKSAEHVFLNKVNHTGLVSYYNGRYYVCRQLKEITDGKGRGVYEESCGVLSKTMSESVIRNYALRQAYNKAEYQEYKEGKRKLEDVTMEESVEWVNDFNHKNYKKLVDGGMSREKAYGSSWNKEEEGYVYYKPHFKTGWSIQSENMQKKIDTATDKTGMIRVLFDKKNNRHVPVQLVGYANVAYGTDKEKLMKNEGCLYETAYIVSVKLDYSGGKGDKNLDEILHNSTFKRVANCDIKNGDRIGVAETLFGLLNPRYVGTKEVTVLITHGHGGQAQIELDRLNSRYKGIHFNTVAIYADSARGKVSGSGKFRENEFTENLDAEGVDYLLMDVVNTTRTEYYTNPDKLGYTLAKEVMNNFSTEKGVTYILPKLLSDRRIAVGANSIAEICNREQYYTSMEYMDGAQVMVQRDTQRFIMDYCVYNFLDDYALSRLEEFENLTVISTKN